MNSPTFSRHAIRLFGAVAALGCASAFAGCGMPGAPQPPSLNLPARVNDLSAVRNGDQVILAWSMPTRNTDSTLIKGSVSVRVCRGGNGADFASCFSVATLRFAPGSTAGFSDTLPASLADGHPPSPPYSPLTYFVELYNRKGRSSGPSNIAEVLAGPAPPPVTNFAATVRPGGILLSWAPAPGSPSNSIRLERKLLTPSAKKPAQGSLAPPPEPLEQDLLVSSESQTDRALDTHILFGNAYEYRAQRVARITVNGRTHELASALSSPVRIIAENDFPPPVPTGLAAVATPAAGGEPPAIDLSWLPVTSVDLAGYIVYRRDVTQAESALSWRRISPPSPVVGPAYHDAAVQPGHIYQYVVTSIGLNGRESARSADAQETVPAE